MVEMYGLSGCTSEILNHFYHMGRGDIRSFPEVEIFDREYSLPGSVYGTETLRLRQEISQLKDTLLRLQVELKARVSNRETLLAAERDGIPAKIQVLSESVPNPIVRLWHWFQCLRLRWRLHTLTQHFPREVAKPFKKDEEKIARVRGEHDYLDSHFETIFTKRFEGGKRAKQYLDDNRQLFIGAAGEEAVIRDLRMLPDPWVVFNNLRFSLNRSVFWKQGREYVRSSQVDHVVVGPGGVFLLETKNWGRARVTSEGGFTPEHQVERAGFIFYIIASDRFRYKLPTRNLVVMVQGCSVTRYQFVTKVPLSGLVSHLLRAPRCLTDEQIFKVSNWLIKKHRV